MILSDNWKIGASVKDIGSLEQAAEGFERLEIDLSTILGTDSVPDHSALRERLYGVNGKLYSVHLRKGEHLQLDSREQRLDALEPTIEDIAEIKNYGAEIAVAHLMYPGSFDEMVEQLRTIAKYAEQHGVKVYIENLADRKNHTNGYMGPRDPRIIAEALEEVNSDNLGLCLDTSHAACNDINDYDTELVRKWLRHVHYSEGEKGRDVHLPISARTSKESVAHFEELLANAEQRGTVMLENYNMADVVASADYLHKPVYDEFPVSD